MKLLNVEYFKENLFDTLLPQILKFKRQTFDSYLLEECSVKREFVNNLQLGQYPSLLDSSLQNEQALTILHGRIILTPMLNTLKMFCRKFLINFHTSVTIFCNAMTD